MKDYKCCVRYRAILFFLKFYRKFSSNFVEIFLPIFFNISNFLLTFQQILLILFFQFLTSLPPHSSGIFFQPSVEIFFHSDEKKQK